MARREEMMKRREKEKRNVRERTRGGENERKEACGPGGATQLPDHVIAERRCQNAAEDKNMHIRQREEGSRGG